jgi:N-acetylmuramic acid 6-phosphate etherase
MQPPDSPWRRLPTEGRHPQSDRLDRMASAEIVALVLDEDRRGLEAARRAAPEIARAADLVAETLGGGGVLLFAGAGTSGRLGILEAAECPPTFGVDPERIRAAMAGGDTAVFRAQEGAEDRAKDGERAAAGLAAGDLLFAISASSVTPFARAALAAARGRGARSVLLTCAPAAGLEGLADLLLALDTGPEVLTGSTRLKAGSATKAVLNAVTTAAMVRLGKTYENLMVDLRPGSAKLRDRARRILEMAAGLTAEDAERLQRAAGGELKTALVMARLGVSAEEARRRLAAADGHVWRALEIVSPG